MCVCQCLEMYRRQSKRSVEGGICGLSKDTFSSMPSFSSPSRASSLVLIVIRGVIGGVSVYEINGRIDVVNFFSFFLSFVYFAQEERNQMLQI